jgi:capsular polysaccharide transport system permease protein
MQRRRFRMSYVWALFFVIVALPTLASAVYFGAFASDLYVSESRFTVRSAARPQVSTLAGILDGGAFSKVNDDAYVVQDYILSRDALRLLDQEFQLKQHVSQGEVDFYSRFPGLFDADNSFENFFLHYKKHSVKIHHDAASGITTLRVAAFDAAFAQKLNERLLSLSERLVNNLNGRSRADSLGYAKATVEEAEKRVQASTVALSRFRTSRTVFDPDKQSALQLQRVGKLQDELLEAKMQLAQIRRVSPDSPQIEPLRTRISVLQRESKAASAAVTGESKDSLAAQSGDFERLNIERVFAERQLSGALALYEQARSEAVKKNLYLERIVQPSLPDRALEPRRLRSTITAAIALLIAWGILCLLVAGIREHRL